MTELKDNQFVFVDEEGTEVLCDIIFTYDSEKFKKSYVFFTPVGSQDDNGQSEVGVASYVPENGGVGEINAVESDEEWEELEEVFSQFVEDNDLDGDCDCGCDDDCDCDSDCDDDCCCGCGHHHDDN